MHTVDEIVTALRALPPDELKEVKKQVWPRKYSRRDQKPLELVRHTTWHILMEMLKTIEDVLPEEWLIDLTSKEIDALPLEKWKNTSAGREVFEREGQETFEAWVNDKKKKLMSWKQLQMKELVELVAHRLGLTRQRKHPKGGKFRKDVQNAKDEFLMGTGLDWPEVPSALRDERQPRFSGDLESFYDQQLAYLRGANDKGLETIFNSSFGSTRLT
jgi:hypothetical protein